jgi:hypothetical protein
MIWCLVFGDWYELMEEVLHMDKAKYIFCGLIFLMIVAFGMPAGSAEQDTDAKANAAEKDTVSPQRDLSQGIPCNWSGWKNSFPGVKCARNRCNRYREVLSMLCTGGSIAEVKTDRVCAGCWDR